MDELIVHIGPPKTATTRIQDSLRLMRHELLQQGIALDISGGMAAHYQQVLRIISSDKTASQWNGWFAADARPPDLPERVARGRQLVTSEDLFDVSSHGAARLFEWSGARALRVVSGIREPARWLWSYWQQLCKSPGRPDWLNFVAEMTMTRKLFPSTLLAPWESLGVKARFSFFDIEDEESGGPVNAFLAAIGYELNSGETSLTVHETINASMGVVEAILSGILADEILLDLRTRSWVLWGDIPDDFIARCCLDLIDKARPMYELGVAYGRETSGSAIEPLLDSESADALRTYRTLWAADAVESADRSIVTDQGRDVLLNAVKAYEARDAFEGFRGVWGSGFPRRNVVDHIELPGSMQPVIRSLSTAVGLRYQAALLGNSAPTRAAAHSVMVSK